MQCFSAAYLKYLVSNHVKESIQFDFALRKNQMLAFIFVNMSKDTDISCKHQALPPASVFKSLHSSARNGRQNKDAALSVLKHMNVYIHTLSGNRLPDCVAASSLLKGNGSHHNPNLRGHGNPNTYQKYTNIRQEWHLNTLPCKEPVGMVTVSGGKWAI